MKTSHIISAALMLFMLTIAARGQSTVSFKLVDPNMESSALVLTRDDVVADSVRVFGPDKGANLVFIFAHKTSNEIEKIKLETLGKKVSIKDGDKVLAVGGAGGGYTDKEQTQGLVLIFETKAEATIAARVLRGEKAD